MSMLKVVCAIIRDDKDRCLLVQRAGNMSHPLKWEFPGGKVELDETPFEAIQRELREELDIELSPKQLLNTVEWEYPGKKIALVPIICELRLSEIRLLEHRDYGWFFLKEISSLDLLEADRAILKQLN